jgi:hypothetical protein
MAVAQTQVIMDWLATIGWDISQETGYPVFPGPYIEAEPDRAVFITGGGGPGYTTEEPATDASVFQARVRGPSGDPLAAEAAAQLLDSLILRAALPASIDGTWINSISRSGNGPTPLPLDPGDLRQEFTTNYVIVTGV